MSKPTAFLDLDGPLLDVSHKHFVLYQDLLKDFAQALVPYDDFWAAKRQKVSDAQLLGRSDLSDQAPAFTARKIELIETEAYLRHDRLQAEALETLAELRNRYHLVLVTLRRSRDALMWQLKHLGLDKCLDHVLTSADHADAERGEGWVTKAKLVRDAGFRPTRTDFFAGDTETDILAGQALDTTTVAVLNGIRDDHFLLALHPNLAFASIAELRRSSLLR